VRTDRFQLVFRQPAQLFLIAMSSASCSAIVRCLVQIVEDAETFVGLRVGVATVATLFWNSSFFRYTLSSW